MLCSNPNLPAEERFGEDSYKSALRVGSASACILGCHSSSSLTYYFDILISLKNDGGSDQVELVQIIDQLDTQTCFSHVSRCLTGAGYN